MEEIYRRDVQPAVLEIEETVRSNAYWAALAQNLTKRPLVATGGSALAIAISHLSFLPDVISQAFGITTGTAYILHDTYREWKSRKREVEQNHMYFYYEAGERLRDMSSA